MPVPVMNSHAGWLQHTFDAHLQRYKDRLLNGDLEAVQSLLLTSTQDATWNQNVPWLEYLLKAQAGLPLSHCNGDNFQMTKLVDWAIVHKRFDIAVILRTHGALISSELKKRITLLLTKNPAACDLPKYWFDESREVWKAIKNPTTLNAIPLYYHTEYLGATVRQSWPPEPLQWPQELDKSVVPKKVRTMIDTVVRTYWQKIADMRRQEARNRTQRNWDAAKRWYQMWRIVCFWQGITQETQCAPGGAGRKADLARFKKEFVF